MNQIHDNTDKKQQYEIKISINDHDITAVHDPSTTNNDAEKTKSIKLIWILTLCGIIGVYLISYIISDIWLLLKDSNLLLTLSLFIILILKLIMKAETLVTFSLCRIVDSFGFSFIFFLIQHTDLLKYSDLMEATVASFILFVVACASSFFIKIDYLYKNLYYLQLLCYAYFILSLIELFIYLGKYRKQLLFINKLSCLISILVSLVLISISNFSIQRKLKDEDANSINIWNESNMLTSLFLKIIYDILNYIINKRTSN